MVRYHPGSCRIFTDSYHECQSQVHTPVWEHGLTSHDFWSKNLTFKNCMIFDIFTAIKIKNNLAWCVTLFWQLETRQHFRTSVKVVITGGFRSASTLRGDDWRFSRTFRDKISVPSSKVTQSKETVWPLKMGSVCCAKISLKYQPMPRNTHREEDFNYIGAKAWNLAIN